MKTYLINGKKYKVERVCADSSTELIDRLIYLLIEIQKQKANSSNEGDKHESKTS